MESSTLNVNCLIRAESHRYTHFKRIFDLRSRNVSLFNHTAQHRTLHYKHIYFSLKEDKILSVGLFLAARFNVLSF
jgi:hypothetical protein